MNNIEVKMPRLGTNDDYVTIGQWNVENGSYVQKGRLLAVVETTKETLEIEAEAEGYIQQLYPQGADVLVGEVIAKISDTRISAVSEKETKEERRQQGLQMTKKAEELINKYQVDLSALDSRKIIRESDILQLLGQENRLDANADGHEIGANGIIIVSGGGLAKMCIDVLRMTRQFCIHGITDKYLPAGKTVMDVPVLGDDTVLDTLWKQGCRQVVNAVGGIANKNTMEKFGLRRQIYKMLKEKGFLLPNLIHPKAAVEPSVKMGEGNLVFAGASIGSCAEVGNNCLINTGAIVSHDCMIGNHAKISPGAVLGGGVAVGENSLVGMGVTIYFGVTIGKNVIIGNGKHIFSDVPDGAEII